MEFDMIILFSREFILLAWYHICVFLRLHAISGHKFKCTFYHHGTLCKKKKKATYPLLFPVASHVYGHVSLLVSPCYPFCQVLTTDLIKKIIEVIINIDLVSCIKWAKTCRWLNSHQCRYDEGTQEDKKQQEQLELHGGCWSECQNHNTILCRPWAESR